MNKLKTIEHTTVQRSISEVTTSLIELLQSHQAVANVVGVKQGRTVKGWAENMTLPSDPVMSSRLMVAENLARFVHVEDSPWVSRAWLISCNPHLEGDNPMDYLQALNGTDDDKTVVARLQNAADQFVNN